MEFSRRLFIKILGATAATLSLPNFIVAQKSKTAAAPVRLGFTPNPPRPNCCFFGVQTTPAFQPKTHRYNGAIGVGEVPIVDYDRSLIGNNNYNGLMFSIFSNYQA